MKRQVMSACALMLLGLAASPVRAQSTDTIPPPIDGPGHDFGGQMINTEPPVFQNDLDGPRVGLTFMPNGAPRTQFGWHSESQAGSGVGGPWFLVERIWLIGGVEKGEFIPSGTLIFGVRTPGGFEFGVGPSLTLGPEGFTTAIVAAAGQTLRYGGIRVPVNLAVAMSNREGRSAVRVSLITGWAIKQSSRYERRPYKYRLER